MNLTLDQSRALDEIMKAYRPGAKHLLTGYAGTGKTTLMQEVTRELLKRRLSVVLTAPTHKAVAVLRRKLQEAGINGVDCRTISSLLSLKPKPHSDRLIFTRDKRAEPVMSDVVVIDECSMVSSDLMVHIKRHLPVSFVLFVGDPAQLPPVGEIASQTFDTPGRSNLNTIVRQGADNPVLAAATTIRASQGGPMDMSWCRSANAKPFGVYMPRTQADAWMQKAFTNADFDINPDRFRYLCWTNARVAEVNDKVRRWRYGDNIPTPFMAGERAMVRAPVIRDGTILFNTNEEAEVREIATGVFEYGFDACEGVEAWTGTVSSWRIVLRDGDGCDHTVHMVANERDWNRVIARVTDEATECQARWRHLHAFKSAMARLQSIYAMTVHTSQGSTFETVFMDVPDIRRRESSNLLETQQLFYVAATRPSHALVLVG